MSEESWAGRRAASGVTWSCAYLTLNLLGSCLLRLLSRNACDLMAEGDKEGWGWGPGVLCSPALR